MDSAGRVARLDTSRRNVDGKLTMWMKTMWTALNCRRMLMPEECGLLEELEDDEMIRECRERREVEQSIGRSEYRKNRADGCGRNRDGLGEGDADKRDGFSKIRED